MRKTYQALEIVVRNFIIKDVIRTSGVKPTVVFDGKVDDGYQDGWVDSNMD